MFTVDYIDYVDKRKRYNATVDYANEFEHVCFYESDIGKTVFATKGEVKNHIGKSKEKYEYVELEH